MPYIQLKTTDEQHKEIKMRAIGDGMTIPEYVSYCVNITMKHDAKFFDKPYGVTKIKEQPTPSKANASSHKCEHKVLMSECPKCYKAYQDKHSHTVEFEKPTDKVKIVKTTLKPTKNTNDLDHASTCPCLFMQAN